MGSGPSRPYPSSMGVPATFKTYRPTFRASGPCCVFRVPHPGAHKRRSEHKSPRKWPRAEPQSDPKATDMIMPGPFKNHGIYGVGATLGHLGRGRNQFFFLLAFLPPTFVGFCWLLLIFGSTWVPNGPQFSPKLCPRSTISPPGAHKWPRLGHGEVWDAYLTLHYIPVVPKEYPK